MEIEVMSAFKMISRMTVGRLNDKQINRSIAYMRAKGLAFYDPSGRDHMVLNCMTAEHRIIILEALKIHYNYL